MTLTVHLAVKYFTYKSKRLGVCICGRGVDFQFFYDYDFGYNLID